MLYEAMTESYGRTEMRKRQYDTSAEDGNSPLII